MVQTDKTRNYYNNYGSKEWDRLDKTAYDKLNFLLHMDFVSKYLKKGIEVFDVGCGAGRFSVEFAESGCNVSILDISEEQLLLAKSKMKDYKVEKRLKYSVIADLADMSMIEDNKFDVTVCYGAPLNYLFDNYTDGIKELFRVTKSGGNVVVSVNSRLGIFRTLLGKDNFNINNFLGRPDYWMINEVLKTGNLPEHPDVPQPPRHFFVSKELKALFKKAGFKNIKLASSPCVISGLRSKAEEIYKDKNSWNTLLGLELRSYKNEYLADSGEFLLLSASK